MKVIMARINDEGIQLRLDSETQAESSLLVEIANVTAKPVKTYGRVTPDSTYVWFTIPIRKVKWNANLFGNDK